MPRIEIILSQIQDNARALCEFYGSKGISLMGVSKAVLGEPAIAQAMIQGGVRFIADSRLENLHRIKQAGLVTELVLLRTALSQAEQVVAVADISLNTEFETLKKLSHYAAQRHREHRVILMVELGDLREGLLPSDLPCFVRKTLALPALKLIGIGCNLACYGGIKPDDRNMAALSQLVGDLEKTFCLSLGVNSGGNSANYQWFKAAQSLGRVNNLRLGESILLGRETVDRQAIPGLHLQAFQLVAEVIESKRKPSLPLGQVCQDAFGHVPQFEDVGMGERVILALGRQDVSASNLSAPQSLEILGASSDHLILDGKDRRFAIGEEVQFGLDYAGLLSAMTSPFVEKRFVLGPDGVLANGAAAGATGAMGGIDRLTNWRAESMG